MSSYLPSHRMCVCILALTWARHSGCIFPNILSQVALEAMPHDNVAHKPKSSLLHIQVVIICTVTAALEWSKQEQLNFCLPEFLGLELLLNWLS